MRIFRVVVRGEFAALDEGARQRLLADQGDHDIFRSSFTADGCFTYDERLVAFNFRFEIRDSDALADDEIELLAIERAASKLAQMGLAHKRLRATATDMASMWS